MKIILLFSGLFLFANCRNEPKIEPFYQIENAEVFNDVFRFEETDEIVFPVDSNVWVDASILQILHQGGENFLFIFTPYTLRLDIYDYDKRQRLRSVQFKNEGPDGAGLNTELMGFFAISPDTFLIHNYSEQKIKIFDIQARKLISVDLPEPDVDYFSTIFSHSPPFKVGHYVYIPNLYQGILGNYLVDVKQIPALMRFNTNSFQYDFIGSRSEVYEIGYNVAGDNSYTYAIYNQNERKIIYSFRQDHFLYSINEKNRLEKHYVGSKYFKELYPLCMDVNQGISMANTGDPSLAFYVRTSPKYDRLLYDNVNQLYYRFTYLPRTKEEYDAGKFVYKRSVIIFNEQFEKLGEWIIPVSTYSLYSAFAATDGLLLVKENEKDENNLVFGLLKPVPISKLD